MNITKWRRHLAFASFSLLWIEENMAPQWSCLLSTILDDEEQLILILAVYRQLTKQQRGWHRWWVHNILKKRCQHGTFHHLVKEMQLDGERFQQRGV